MWGQEKQDAKKTGEATAEEGAPSVVAAPDGPEDIIAFVGKGVEFKGVISYSGTVRIDGYLDGEIHTDGVLLIGDEAVIQAKVTAGTIVCKGKITGDITAKERVKLRAPIVIRLDGTNAEEGRAILKDHESEWLISQPTMLDAARKAVDLAKGE